MILKFAIKEFEEEKEFNQLTKKSISNYMGTLKQFHQYSTEQGIVDVSDIDTSLIKSYLLYCQKERKNSPTTINTKLRGLKVFFNFLESIDVFDSKTNPAKKVRFQKVDVRIEVFSDKQISDMLTYYRRLKTRENTFYAYRDTTIIITLLGTGMRLGELINLKWSDIDLPNRHLIVFGKLRTQTSIPIADRLQRELLEYRLYCEQIFKRLPKCVFVDRKGNRLSGNGVHQIFKRLQKRMNFSDVRCCTYDFRHTFAHRFLMNGGDVFTLQKLLRHSDISMTQRYLALWGTALQERNDKYNPLNNLNF